MTPGAIARLDFLGHPLHGKVVRIAEVVPAFNLAPPDADPCLAEVIFIAHPSLPEPVGIHPCRLAGTAENARVRSEEAGEDERQGELLL